MSSSSLRKSCVGKASVDDEVFEQRKLGCQCRVGPLTKSGDQQRRAQQLITHICRARVRQFVATSLPLAAVHSEHSIVELFLLHPVSPLLLVLLPLASPYATLAR